MTPRADALDALWRTKVLHQADVMVEIRKLELEKQELAKALEGLLSRVEYDKDAKHWWPDAQQVAFVALARHRAEQP